MKYINSKHNYELNWYIQKLPNTSSDVKYFSLEYDSVHSLLKIETISYEIECNVVKL